MVNLGDFAILLAFQPLIRSGAAPVLRLRVPPLCVTPVSEQIDFRRWLVTFPLLLPELNLTIPASLFCLWTLVQLCVTPLLIRPKHLEHTGITLAGGKTLLVVGAPISLEWLSKCFWYWGPIILPISHILQEHLVSDPLDLVVGPGALKSAYGSAGGRCLLEFSPSYIKKI